MAPGLPCSPVRRMWLRPPWRRPGLPVPASALEGQLQQLFLQADPELRKRFIGWAVPRL